MPEEDAPPLAGPGQQPWWDHALEHLDLRRGDRVLVVGASSPPHLLAMRRVVGSRGLVFAVDARLESAEAASRAGVETLHHSLEGDERLGMFDALLMCPIDAVELSVSAGALLAVQNLRLGGRLVADLPAPAGCPQLAAAWREAGGGSEVSASLCGPPAGAWSRALDEAGLRDVSCTTAAYLVPFESPMALATVAAGLWDADASLVEATRLLLVRHLRTTGPIEVAWHRLRATAIR